MLGSSNREIKKEDVRRHREEPWRYRRSTTYLKVKKMATTTLHLFSCWCKFVGINLHQHEKDSPSRKTIKYIEEKRLRLNTIFQRAQDNHTLLEGQEVMSTHKYLTTNKLFWHYPHPEAIQRRLRILVTV